MECTRCDESTRVLESRRAEDGAALRRRRECSACGHRFTTFERPTAEPLYVGKRDGERQRFDRTKLRAALLRSGERQRFDRTKLRAALLRSTHKRQVSAADVEALVDRVELAIATSDGQLPAPRIGELCVEGLRDLDYGAYLQFLGTLPSPHPATTSNPDFARPRRRAECIVTT